MENKELFEGIRSIIAEIAEIEAETIKGDSKFADDLGIDSMRALEIVVQLEKKYKIRFEESQLSNIIKEIHTINDAVEKTSQQLLALERATK
jgi:acyl carrier protein